LGVVFASVDVDGDGDGGVGVGVGVATSAGTGAAAGAGAAGALPPHATFARTDPRASDAMTQAGEREGVIIFPL
jgi:hypothetical protein